MADENEDTDDVDEANQQDGADQVNQQDQVDEVALNALLASGVSPLVALAGSVRKGGRSQGDPDPSQNPSPLAIAVMALIALFTLWLMIRF